MTIRKDKNSRLAVPTEGRGQITTKGPLDLWSDMDRLFERFRSSFDDLFWPWGTRSGSVAPTAYRRTPPMDVADMGDRFEIRLEMPGISKDNVDIQVTPNVIEVTAEGSETKEERDKNWLRRECSSTSFYRALELPEEIKTDDVDAELRDGVLTITLPKTEPKPEYKPKKIRPK